MTRHLETYRVPFGDTDAAGVVFYPNYYRWFDRMTHELFRAAGLPLLDLMIGAREGPVLVETHCRFMAPVRYDDLVELEAELTDLRERSFRVDHRVLRAGEPVAIGHEIRVWIRLTPGGVQPAELPDPIRRLEVVHRGGRVAEDPPQRA